VPASNCKRALKESTLLDWLWRTNYRNNSTFYDVSH